MLRDLPLIARLGGLFVVVPAAMLSLVSTAPLWMWAGAVAGGWLLVGLFVVGEAHHAPSPAAGVVEAVAETSPSVL